MKKKLLIRAILILIVAIVFSFLVKTSDPSTLIGWQIWLPKAENVTTVFEMDGYNYEILKYDSDILSKIKRFSTFDKIYPSRLDTVKKLNERFKKGVKSYYSKDDESSTYNRPKLIKEFAIPIKEGYYYFYYQEPAKYGEDEIFMVYDPKSQLIYKIVHCE